ncbi:MAG TPA: alpha-amylase family glycosyl hydrolase, partial [Elusimicrobiota bacterium]|nr:alpha-amylase family glycosyl hydrolase [Elusimicrobiota bacterium]
MSRFPGRAAALLLAAAVVLAGTGAPAFAQQEAAEAAAAAAPSAGSASAGAAALAPLSPVSALPVSAMPAAADGPSLAPSPWNPASPTKLLAAPAPKLAPAVGAASMPPLAPAIGAASMPPVAARTGAASMPPVAAASPRGPPAAAEETAGAAHASGAKALRTAAAVAERLNPAAPDAGELPPPSDAVDSLAQAALKLEPGRAHYPSPEDWRDETLYSIFLDRFNKGAGGSPVGDPASGLTRHGGNIRGVIDKLDYLKESGVTTLLISPVAMTVPEAYHGYAPVHFLAVDPHLGSMADFKELVAKAHAKGLRVVLDWVINHAGPVFEYADGKTQWTGDNAPGPIEWTRTLKPVELAADDFTRERVITDWNDENQATHGDFPPNYRHFATDRPETQRKLIHVAQWWMKETDIDGF